MGGMNHGSAVARRIASTLAGPAAAAAVLLAAGCLATTLTACTAPRKPPKGLNLLLITLDTTRADALGCYGSVAASTPNLDRLAAGGARFARVTACTPMTLPSHCTILTGTWPLEHGVRSNGRGGALQERSVTVAEVLAAAGFQTRAVVASFVLKRMFGLAQGFDVYDDQMTSSATNRPALERPGDQVADAAIAALVQLSSGRFFLWVHFYDPHLPYLSRSGNPPGSRAAYAEEISFVDLQVGRVLQELERVGVAGRTAVVVVGDHGEGLGDHGETEHGFLLYETTQRVPLLLRCPGFVPAGKVVEERVRTVDVAPTLIALAGVERPAEMRGESVLPLALGAGTHPGREAYGESWEAHSTLAMAPLHSLHRDDWKFVDAPRPKLFDLSADPFEEHNLAAENPTLVEEMRRELMAIVASSEAAPVAGIVDDDTADALAALGYASSAGDGGPSVSADMTEGADARDPYENVGTIEAYAAAVRAMVDDPPTAERLLREVIRARPEAPAALYDLTRMLRRQRREGEVMDLCRTVLDEHPDARLRSGSRPRAPGARPLARPGGRRPADRAVASGSGRG
jgi:choline-sulfatase